MTAAALAIAIPAVIWLQTGRIGYTILGLMPAATAQWLVGFGLTNPDAKEASSDQSDHSDSLKSSNVNWSRMG